MFAQFGQLLAGATLQMPTSVSRSGYDTGSVGLNSAYPPARCVERASSAPFVDQILACNPRIPSLLVASGAELGEPDISFMLKRGCSVGPKRHPNHGRTSIARVTSLLPSGLKRTGEGGPDGRAAA